MQLIEYSPWDLGYDDPNDAPVCVCPEYAGAKHPTFCKACGDWTDNIEIAKMEAAEKSAAIVVVAEVKPVLAPVAPRKPMAPAYGIASIGNGLYCRTAPPKKSKRRAY